MIRKILKVVRNIILVSVLVLFILIIYVEPNRNPKTVKKSSVKPVVVKTYFKPTEDDPHGYYRIEYDYGVFIISRDFAHSSGVGSYGFLDVRTAWPEFGGRDYYGKSASIDEVRLIFEIGNDNTPFENLYYSLQRNREKNAIDTRQYDRRFNGLVGYKLRDRSYFSLYEVTDKNTPNFMGTPTVIRCTEDNFLGHDLHSRQGSCRYNLIIDSSLRAQIRFNKPHLKNFIVLHKKVMQLINDIRTEK